MLKNGVQSVKKSLPFRRQSLGGSVSEWEVPEPREGIPTLSLDFWKPKSKSAEVAHTFGVPSLDEGSCDDVARTPRFLRWTKAGAATIGQDGSVTRVDFVRTILRPWLGPVVIYSGHQHLWVIADCKPRLMPRSHVEDEKAAEVA